MMIARHRRKPHLVLVGHGLEDKPASTRPVRRQAAALRRRAQARRLFGGVHPAFWRAAPRLDDVIRRWVHADLVVVPCFTSGGHFTHRVLPHALGLQGPPPRCVRCGGRWLAYGEPVGTHPGMVRVIARCVRQAGAGGRAAVILVAHGTMRHRRSAMAVRRQAAALRALGRYAEVEVAFLDQAPRIEEVLPRVRAREIVIVPYFIAEGGHARVDLPRRLGLAPSVRATVIDGRRLWYGPPVGLDPYLATIILDRARCALRTIPTRASQAAEQLSVAQG